MIDKQTENTHKKPQDIVEGIVSQYIDKRPRKIALKLSWNDKTSAISFNGDNLNHTIEIAQTIDFTSFARGILDTYQKVYGEMEVFPTSFREEIYKNDKVALDLYPSGSSGRFDILVNYK